MSSDFYFSKWKELIMKLEKLIESDIEFQQHKVHDKTLCDAVSRLGGVLGQYVQLYNDCMECLQQNLQVQKARYISDVVKAICLRITEIKHQLHKLESSNVEFIAQGLANSKLTTEDVELSDVPSSYERPKYIKTLLEEAFKQAKERREEEVRVAVEEEQEEDEDEVVNWWDDETKQESEGTIVSFEKESEESLIRRQMATLIQSQERSRQVTQYLIQRRQRRALWVRELEGTSRPQAPDHLKLRSARLIQKAMRAYFEIKRKRINQCREDEILGVRICLKSNQEVATVNEEMKYKRSSLREEYEEERINYYSALKQKYIDKNAGTIAEDYRDFIREWFRKWFDDIKYFHDIPKDYDGGSIQIMMSNLPEPIEWWEEYEKYLEEKKSNKNTTALQRKWAKQEAKREEATKKKEEQIKIKLQNEMMRKLMKNPTKHPGFHYPQTKHMTSILEAVQRYKRDWTYLDFFKTLDVKKKYVHDIEKDIAYGEAKREIMTSVDEDMRNELKILKKALKSDYMNNDEKMPEPMKATKKRRSKKNKVNAKISHNISDKLEDLAYRGILTQYPRTDLSEFLGDHNFTGDDIRCSYRQGQSFNGELRTEWWEICLDATQGFRRVLLVGPKGCGKSILVHALASANDAVLFVLDPNKLTEESLTADDLKKILSEILSCARVAQPAVIYVRDVHKLFYKKVPPSESAADLNMIRRLLLQKICKNIHKNDNVTIVGGCVDPWKTKGNKILKMFSMVVLVPNTSYSTIMQLLQIWIQNNTTIPKDLNVSSLAYVLRGYSYGYIKEMLIKFLSPDRVIKIAAKGLSPLDIYNFFLDNASDNNVVEYHKYLKWYYEKTQWGKKERRHAEEQSQFAEALQFYAEKAKKKQKLASAVSSVNTMASRIK